MESEHSSDGSLSGTAGLSMIPGFRDCLFCVPARPARFQDVRRDSGKRQASETSQRSSRSQKPIPLRNRCETGTLEKCDQNVLCRAASVFLFGVSGDFDGYKPYNPLISPTWTLNIPTVLGLLLMISSHNSYKGSICWATWG